MGLFLHTKKSLELTICYSLREDVFTADERRSAVLLKLWLCLGGPDI